MRFTFSHKLYLSGLRQSGGTIGHSVWIYSFVLG